MKRRVSAALQELDDAFLELKNEIDRRNLIRAKVVLENLTVVADRLRNVLPKKTAEDIFQRFDRRAETAGLLLKNEDFQGSGNILDDIELIDLPFLRNRIKSFFAEQGDLQRRISSLSRSVFIVHGRDLVPMRELCEILKRWKLNPIVLMEQAGGSRAIIEKLEKHSRVSFAFVILTPDDLGICKSDICRENASLVQKELYEISKDLNIVDLQKNLAESCKQFEKGSDFFVYAPFSEEYFQMAVDAVLKSHLDRPRVYVRPRARQNAIMEFGYFAGLLGRDRVCCLRKGDCELPSDLYGVSWIQFNKSINEENVRKRILEELREAGYKV